MSEKDSIIESDNNWKEQAQKDKEKLSEKEEPTGSSQEQSSGDNEQQGPMPEANLMMLINSLAIQAMVNLGRFSDPSNPDAKPQVNLEIAKHHIDLLQVINDKTKGNLTDEEEKTLTMALHELRMAYVQTAS